MSRVEMPAQSKQLAILFLGSLFLYPFSAVGHSLYLVPQLLLVLLAVINVAETIAPNAIAMKSSILLLAAATASTAFLREIVSTQPEFIEPVKLLINLATVCVLLFFWPVFDPDLCAKWLKRVAVLWLFIVAFAYAHNDASTGQLLLSLFEPEGLTSTHLYEIAEPLATIFLTKNIFAMYVVAVFGSFLYFRRRAHNPASIMDKLLFMVLIVSLFSRQAIVAGIVLVGLDNLVGREKHAKRWAVIGMIMTALVVGIFFAFAFDLNSQQDGATTRLELWSFFLSNWNRFSVGGLGIQGLNLSLDHLNIDNYHMFFMNQIAAYGIAHCLAFNALIALISWRAAPRKIKWLVLAPYWLNVCFQTYGYEYGNLFLFCIAANSWNEITETDAGHLGAFSAPAENTI
jgi:hypothetical protein